jgi:hypothetical protein
MQQAHMVTVVNPGLGVVLPHATSPIIQVCT